METELNSHSFGWMRDLPDIRDFTLDEVEFEDPPNRVERRDETAQLLEACKVVNPPAKAVTAKKKMDLRAWCSPIEDQRHLGSCTAHAGVGVIEYYERRAFGRHIDASRLFLYKVTRNLLHWTGDTGAYLRTTMGAMALFGTPPEEYWRYTDTSPDWNLEPPAFCYSYAANYKALRYLRLDPTGIGRPALMSRVKLFILAGLPPMFGFTVYNSYTQAAANKGKIPFPAPGDRAVGGHAIVAVGFDDDMEITHNSGRPKTKGALLIRNSWGTGWGDHGYGWLPYRYVLSGLAVDWWALLKADWINTGKFGL
jgi:C1A family cysteine protease